jgi:hypothetical protein
MADMPETGANRFLKLAEDDALAILKWQGFMGATMNFSSSNDRSLLTLWESVRRQVIADRADAVAPSVRTCAPMPKHFVLKWIGDS